MRFICFARRSVGVGEVGDWGWGVVVRPEAGGGVVEAISRVEGGKVEEGGS